MKNKNYKYVLMFILLLSVIFIVSGCSALDSLRTSDSVTEHSLKINEIEYNFYNHENYESPGVEPEPGIYPYEDGSTAYLDVFPTEDIIFYEWAGEDGTEVEPDNGQYMIFMDSPKSITPVFGLAPEDGLALIQGNLKIEHNFPYSVLEDESFYDSSGPDSMQASAESLSSQSLDFEDEDINELIIRFEDFIGQERINEILAELGFNKIDQIPELNSILVKIPEVAIDKAIKLAEEVKGIRYAEPNQKVRALNDYNYGEFEDYLEIPNENQFSDQWHYPLIRLPQAWNIVDTNNIIRVAVIDSGVDINHNNLEDNIDFENKYNFIDENQDLTDNSGHGTHVAGTIGADKLNTAGILYDNIRLLPLKALDINSNNETVGEISDLVKAILYSADLYENRENTKPVQIINLSLGIENSSSTLKDAIDTVVDDGIIIVASSGNDGGNLLYPAKYNNVISVGSVSLDNNNSPKRTESLFESNFDSDLDFVAPGVNVLSTLPGNEYDSMSGTSMAAPHVAGLIGLMLSQEPGLDLDDIRERLARTSMKINEDGKFDDDETGYGLINAYWALNDVKEIKVILGREDILKEEDGSIKVSLNDNKVVAEKTILLNEGFYDKEDYKFDFSFNGIEPGDYRLIGLIDVSNSSTDNNYIKIEPGDYFFVEDITVQADETHKKDIILKESNGKL